MKNKNWIKLNRKLLTATYFKRDHEKVYFWIYLLMKANWEPKKEMLGGKPIVCNPGQFTTGRRQISDDTGIEQSKVERLLMFFEKTEQQIEQLKTSTNRLITIINWEKYQGIEQQNDANSTGNRTTNEQQTDTPKEYIEDKEHKEERSESQIIVDPRKEQEIADFIKNLMNDPDYD